MIRKHLHRHVQLLLAAFLCILVLHGSPARASRTDEINLDIWYGGGRWVAAENPISQLPPCQRQRMVRSVNPTAAQPMLETAASPPMVSAAALPQTLDWRNMGGQNYVTSVKDQGTCGACWAFSTTAALESQMLIVEKKNLDLSEQALLSCSGGGDCTGGDIVTASNYIRDYGLPIESCLPYAGTPGSCTLQCSYYQNMPYQIAAWDYVAGQSPDVGALKNALYTNGPVVAMMTTYEDYYYYSSGIYTHQSGGNEGMHGILIIGYDDANSCFIVKNDWGTSWGEQGYFRIAYSEVSGDTKFGTYAIAYHRSGNLKVTIYPDNANYSGAKWNVDGGLWRSSGSYANVAAGVHTIRFKDASGWFTPSSRTVNITSAQQTTKLSGTYSLNTAGTYGSASYPSDYSSSSFSSGQSYSSSTGDRSISSTSSSDSGRTPEQRTPYEQPATLQGGYSGQYGSYAASGTTSNPPADRTTSDNKPAPDVSQAPVTGTAPVQTFRTGHLQVKLTPEGAVSAGAKWRMDGKSWQDSNIILTSVRAGNHTIEFNNVLGWEKPVQQKIKVEPDKTAQASANYSTNPPGTLQVTLSPQAAAINARWSVESGKWLKSGESVKLNPGSYTVAYEDLSGWLCPASQKVAVKGTQTCAVSAAYSLPVITVEGPSGAKLRLGTKQKISWKYTGNIGQIVKIEVIRDDFIRVLAESVPAGETGKGSARLLIPKDLQSGGNYRIRVSSKTNSLVSADSSVFILEKHE